MTYRYIEIEIANFRDEYCEAILSERHRDTVPNPIKDTNYRKILREVQGKEEDHSDPEILTESEIRLLPTFVETIELDEIQGISEMKYNYPDDVDYTQTLLQRGKTIFVKINYEKFRNILNEHGGGVLIIE